MRHEWTWTIFGREVHSPLALVFAIPAIIMVLLLVMPASLIYHGILRLCGTRGFWADRPGWHYEPPTFWALLSFATSLAFLVLIFA